MKVSILFYRFVASLLVCVLGSLTDITAQDISAIDDATLQMLLKRFPAADKNGDGTLSRDEASEYAAKMKLGGKRGKNQSKADANQSIPKPTLADVSYGPHERNKMDFWRADTTEPAPLAVFIHGGGFVSGDKSKVQSDIVRDCLKAGVSFASINYRYRTTAPIQDVLRDCARAIQFARTKATDWNIDKNRVASYGGSAGAGTSMWLAFHDDLADPNATDPVLRESTRLTCAGANATQFSYDIVQWVTELGEENAKRFPDAQEPFEFYGLKKLEELYEPVGEKIRADCDMRGLITKDDPPIFMLCTRGSEPIEDKGAYLHHPKHSLLILERCRDVGVEALAVLPGYDIKPASDEPQTITEFIVENLATAK